MNKTPFILFSFIFLGFFLGLQSCRPAKIIPQTIQVDTLIKKDTLVVVPTLNTYQDEISYNYLRAKSKVEWRVGEETNTYIVDFKAKKDSVIWFNVSVALISGGSGIFTPDKMEFLDKIHGKYYSLPYDSLSHWLGIKVNFDEIQNLLVGNKPFSKKNFKVNRQNENFIIEQEKDQIKIDSYFGPNRKLNKLKLKDNLTKNEVEMDFSDFVMINQFLFPLTNEILLNVVNKENKPIQSSIKIKYSKVELLDTPLNINFSVPEKYLKKNEN